MIINDHECDIIEQTGLLSTSGYYRHNFTNDAPVIKYLLFQPQHHRHFEQSGVRNVSVQNWIYPPIVLLTCREIDLGTGS